MNRNLLFTLILILGATLSSMAQHFITGRVFDETKEPIVGASVLIVGTRNGTVTDYDGNFTLNSSKEYPVSITVAFIGYKSQEISVTSKTPIVVRLNPDSEVLQEVNVVERRLSEQQQKSALTVEAMDALAIRETPAVSFYEGLGSLKGVDLTSASIGFKIINTRGFNSTSPVRSLQIIDGVDNQAPGLNFALGNFLGASELDVMNVDIIAGASTSFYGPNAFNGVISMTTKNPYDFQGLSASVKLGERGLQEYAVRWADALKRKDGTNSFGYKLNFYYLRANDWEATNYAASDGSEMPITNPGGYDAVNMYGDENTTTNNDWREPDLRIEAPGLEMYYRNGYREEDIVDYNTENLKLNAGLFYRFRSGVQLSYNSFFGTGTTVYQGENRFSLKDILFFQNVVELKKENKWFVRAYATNENAGNSYDAVVTAFRMNELVAENTDWNIAYSNRWRRNYNDKVESLPGYPAWDPSQDMEAWSNGPYSDFINQPWVQDSLTVWHNQVRNYANTVYPRYNEGTPEFDSVKNYLTNTLFTQGGSKFYDKSALYHIHGQYTFNFSWGDVVVGGNGRMYRPDSKGTIFNELVLTNERYDPTVQKLVYDTAYTQIVNMEAGAYVGWNKRFVNDRLRLNATARIDKNQNFNLLFSPAASAVYDIDEHNTIRFSVSSAIRNPTLQHQYLKYHAGRATLLGNLDGYDSLVTVESFGDFRNTLDKDDLVYFNVDPIRPEQVKTAEVGYRAVIFKKLYVDANYYFSYYTNFIGYKLGLDVDFVPGSNLPSDIAAYRVSANTKDAVSTQGFSIGLNYYLNDHLALNGNYTFNRLNRKGSTDPIIPAFNTPVNKFNLGFTGRNYTFGDYHNGKFGFALNFKWIEGFLFEGSPQFTGSIPSYYLLDAQASYTITSWKTTFKLGASNLTNNLQFQVYGGPYVGRLAYVSILFEIN